MQTTLQFDVHMAPRIFNDYFPRSCYCTFFGKKQRLIRVKEINAYEHGKLKWRFEFWKVQTGVADLFYLKRSRLPALDFTAIRFTVFHLFMTITSGYVELDVLKFISDCPSFNLFARLCYNPYCTIQTSLLLSLFYHVRLFYFLNSVTMKPSDINITAMSPFVVLLCNDSS